MLNQLKKVFTADWSEIFGLVGHMSKKSGRGRLDLFFDMIHCYRKGGYTWLDYEVYEFDRITDAEQRKTFPSEYHDNSSIVRRYNEASRYDIMHDKAQFNRRFEPFLKRDWLDLKQASADEFRTFVEKHNRFFAKPPCGSGGEGVQQYVVKAGDDLSLLRRLLESNGQTVLEERLLQHPELHKMSVNAVIGLRIVTFIRDDGRPVCLYGSLRIPTVTTDVDNVSAGAGWTLLSDEGVALTDGLIRAPYLTSFASHPMTGVPIKGFRVPRYEEAIEFAYEMTSVIPELRYVGWDIAMTPDGPAVIEGNPVPGIDLLTSAAFCPGDIGKRAYLEERMNVTLPPPDI